LERTQFEKKNFISDIHTELEKKLLSIEEQVRLFERKAKYFYQPSAIHRIPIQTSNDMKISAEKLLIFSIAMGITTSCDNKTSDYQNSNSTQLSDIAGDTLNKNLPENDSLLNFRDGVIINEGKEGSDTIQLPKSILESIEKDNLLKGAQIVDKIKKDENGQTIYEVVFYPVNGKEERVTFDAMGKRKTR